MPNDNVVRLIQPETFDDQLTAVLRDGAKALLAKAVEAEVAEFLAKHAALKTKDGHQRVVRNDDHEKYSQCHLVDRRNINGIPLLSEPTERR